MKLYHVTNAQFDKFDTAYLNSASESRTVSDEMENVSKFGFCFVREDELDTLLEVYGEDFGKHIAEVELDDDADENFESDYDSFAAWLEAEGTETVRESLEEDGIDYVELFNGSFWEIIPLHLDDLSAIEWIA
ncbi:MAG: hypothetical protein LUD78_10045 [Clostridiales bacterium]|nr:hypothetical protein [Clostridiales bacterium]